MRYTFKELASIEQTAEQLYTVARTLGDAESHHVQNARHLVNILAELRHAAWMNKEGMSTESKERLIKIVTV